MLGVRRLHHGTVCLRGEPEKTDGARLQLVLINDLYDEGFVGTFLSRL
jgi:hypothetical protein